MRIGEVAARTGATIKAVRYYESIGLVSPDRAANGYREFDEADVRAVREIRELLGLGIALSLAAPFLECLESGHARGDECVSSLAVYRDAIEDLDRKIEALSARRGRLLERLETRAGAGFRPADQNDGEETDMGDEAAKHDYTRLPEGLPRPSDDGAAAHLPGMRVPALTLRSSDGGSVDLAALGSGRSVIYLYPLTGRPGVDLPEGWDAIPGARGCTTEACDFRDHFAELREEGAERVFGLSSQDPAYQAEVVHRLRLPFEMLSDPEFALGGALRLPEFSAPGYDRLYARLTLVIRDGLVERAFYPIFPPNAHAQQVLEWLRDHPLP